MRLRDDLDALEALVGRVSDETGIPFEHVEKDFWLTEALRGMAGLAHDARFTLIFKGGTSLSKAFGLINRFSEDVDILVVLPEGTKGEHDRTLKALVTAAEEASSLAATVQPSGTTKGVKRAARLSYPSAAGETGGLTGGVLLELGTRGGALPSERRSIRSLIAEHFPLPLDEFEDAQPFEVAVLSPARTLVEKLVLLHTAHVVGDIDRVVRTARHYYDVHQVIGRADILDEVRQLGIDVLARDVVTYSTVADLPASPRPAGGFAASPAFVPTGPQLAMARDAFGMVIDQLIWPGHPIPTFDECLEAVASAADAL